MFEALFAEFVAPPILEAGAQGSRLADQIAGAAFGLLGLLAAQKPWLADRRNHYLNGVQGTLMTCQA